MVAPATASCGTGVHPMTAAPSPSPAPFPAPFPAPAPAPSPAPAPGLSEFTWAGSDARADPRTVAAPDGHVDVRSSGRAVLLTVAGAVKRSVGVRLFWTGGPVAEQEQSAGVHALAMQALVRSPAADGSPSLAEWLESTGVAITAGVTDCSCHLDLRGPAELIRPALRAAATAVIRGNLDAGTVRAARAATVHELDRRTHNVRTLADDTFRAARMASGSPFARPPEG